jgi:hypothetical protein
VWSGGISAGILHQNQRERGKHMTNGRSGLGSGTRTTRLGLVALGFLIGVLVTLLVIFMFQLR